MPKRVRDEGGGIIEIPINPKTLKKPCPHGKAQSYSCRDCHNAGKRPSAFCEHENQKSVCLDCLCKHDILRKECTECNMGLKRKQQCEHGNTKGTCVQCTHCVHGNRKKSCVECNTCEHGNAISRCKECLNCCHNVLKVTCKQCGGSRICPHERIKDTCKDCGGKQICIHQRIKGRCIQCGGSQICIHQRRKDRCKECGGSQICIHQRRKAYCRECGGSQICPHSRERRYCRDCRGSAFCRHDKHKQFCVDCGGSGICIHGRNKYCCAICKEENAVAQAAQLEESSSHLAELEDDRLLCPQCEEYKNVVEFVDMSSELQIPNMHCNDCTDIIYKGDGVMCSGGCLKFLFAQQGSICQSCKDEREGAAGGAPGGVHGSGAEPVLASDLQGVLNSAPDF